MSTAGRVRTGAGGPAWSLSRRAADDIAVRTDWPAAEIGDWAWGGATGAGISVCIVDSGVQLDHPDVGPVTRSVAVERDEAGALRVADDGRGDSCGHGTACAGIIRRLAPGCEIVSVRVLDGLIGNGDVLLTGLRWALDQGFDVINLSLSTTRQELTAALHDVADQAYFRGSVLVASAHNSPVESVPWRFSSVISVGSHGETDSSAHYYNPAPPVEFFAPGVNITVPWQGGTRRQCSGNSFATPYVSGLCALTLSKHPGLTPFQVKHVLYLAAKNVAKNVGSHDNPA